MKEIGASIDIVVKVPDHVYQMFIDDDNICDLYALMSWVLKIDVMEMTELSWYEINYPEEL